MGLFRSKQSSARRGRVVATGKRVKGTWMMESRLAAKPSKGRATQAVLGAENRRVRTLH